MTVFYLLVDYSVVVFSVLIKVIALHLDMVIVSKIFSSVPLVDNDYRDVEIVRKLVDELGEIDKCIDLFVFRFGNKIAVLKKIKFGITILL